MSATKTYNYCTLFNTNYLSRGLTLYSSLLNQGDNFHLYIVAFDQECYDTLLQMNFEFATIISLQNFENEQLLSVKNDRSIGEYCWTCTSSVIKYCIEKYALDHCTYLDADLYFFSSPAVLFDELESSSVLITEHRYTPRYDQSEMSGIYCVQFMYFKNDKAGMDCLNWWIDACIDWCYATPEDGKFGDQKYLDDWPKRFNGIHVLEHLGGGLAPWNIQQYDFSRRDQHLVGKEIKTGKEFPAIFYHFHDVRFLQNQRIDLGHYSLRKSDIDLLYKPYLTELQKAASELKKIGFSTDPHGTKETKESVKGYLKRVKRKMKKNLNIHFLSSIINT